MTILYIILAVFLAIGGLVWINSINNTETNADIKELEAKFAEMERSYEDLMNNRFLLIQSDLLTINISTFRGEILQSLYGKITHILLSLHSVRMYSEDITFETKSPIFGNAKTFIGLLLKRLYFRKKENPAHFELTKVEKKEFYSFIMASITDDIRKRASIWGLKVANPKNTQNLYELDHDGWDEWNEWGDLPFYEEEDENDFHNGRKRSDVFPPEDNFVPPNPKFQPADDDDLPF